MSAFLYGVALQWKLDLRSKALLITCYLVPLFFFAIMGGIFTAIDPSAKATLIQNMTIQGVTMGALVGLPPTIAEIYAGDIKKSYLAGGVPLGLGLVSVFLSTCLHLLLMSGILFVLAPFLFGAVLPPSLPRYFSVLVLLIAVSVSVGGVLGLAVKNGATLTMVSQLVFLPSILLSGILFPVDLLPAALRFAGRCLPAGWAVVLLAPGGFSPRNLLPLSAMGAVALLACGFLLHRMREE